MSTVGPVPLRKTPTTPVPPISVVTSNPAAELVARQRRGAMLLQGQLGVGVHIAVQLLQVGDTGGGTELRCGHEALDPDDADGDGQLGLAASRS